MTDEQKKLKVMILADLKMALVGGNSEDKYERLLGAYHIRERRIPYLRHIALLWSD